MASHGKCRITFAKAAVLLICALRIVGQSNAYFQQSMPEAQGVSSRAILSFIEKAEQDIDAIHSYMIIRHGKMISQGWWDPYGAEVPHVLHSLSKSFTSTAIGFAHDEGLLSLNDLVISFFPEETPAEPSWQLKAMRIRDLITMNTGHIKEPRPAADDKDWVRVFLESKLELTPGTHFKYNSMATYMLSAILQKVSGESLFDFLEPRLFRPLGIKKPYWDSCPMGINTGGWGLRVRTEDIAKLGQLYLQKGRWEDNQLLSESWVDMATSKQVSNGSNPDNDWNQGYGFQFWMCRHNCYRGDGAMGQFCIVMPEQDAVVAITSGANDMGRVMQLVWDILLPAMKPAPLAPEEAAFSKLVQKNADLSLKPVAGEKTSPISAQVSRRRYRLEENAAGIKSISLKLHKGEHRIMIEMEHGTESVTIGKQAHVKNELHDHMPYTRESLKKIAASGAWVSPKLYQARIYLYESPARINYTFSFAGDRLIWKTRLEQSLFGARTPEPLTGKQE
jgi:CubicO group peptidase (beta-lactamase class C family)